MSHPTESLILRNWRGTALGLLNKKHFNFPASPIFTACWLAHDLYGSLVTCPEGLKLLEWNEALTSK